LLPEKQVHVDLIVSRLAGHRAIVSDAMQLPLKSECVGAAICVGSVVNHCDAERVIFELARVVRPGGTIALEFDSSDGLHHLKTGLRGTQAAVVQTFYNGTTVGLTEYSVEYIVDVARRAGIRVYARESFHILSAAGLALGFPPPFAALMAPFDPIARRFHRLELAGSNVMLFGYRP
jgi:ubiquinone/menaquinone biosynthesis C-methylase UbiE